MTVITDAHHKAPCGGGLGFSKLNPKQQARYLAVAAFGFPNESIPVLHSKVFIAQSLGLSLAYSVKNINGVIHVPMLYGDAAVFMHLSNPPLYLLSSAVLPVIGAVNAIEKHKPDHLSRDEWYNTVAQAMFWRNGGQSVQTAELLNLKFVNNAAAKCAVHETQELLKLNIFETMQSAI